MFAIGHYITLKMDFFETPMIFAKSSLFHGQQNTHRSNLTPFFGAHFSKATGGSSHHLFPQLHCAIRDEHHPTPPGDVEPPWEVGKGNSLGRFIGRHVF